jgi:GNAT superfamily N-acetyltransferase
MTGGYFMEFRKANVNDVNILVKYRKQQLLDEGGVEINNIDMELKEYFFKNIPNNEFIAWLAIDNNEIIATGGLCFYQLPPTFSNPSGKIGYVTNMFTLKKYRKKGISSKKKKKIIQEAQMLNYKILRLHSSKDGKNIYKKYGFNDYEDFMQLRI